MRNAFSKLTLSSLLRQGAALRDSARRGPELAYRAGRSIVFRLAGSFRALVDACERVALSVLRDRLRALVFAVALALLVAPPPMRHARERVLVGMIAWLPACDAPPIAGATAPMAFAQAPLCAAARSEAIGPAVRAGAPWVVAIYLWGMTLWAAAWIAAQTVRWSRALPSLWRRALARVDAQSTDQGAD
ncbi:hypothetical protein LA345_12840 [Burkholderia vietnamiensis]|uniref:Uncharacterized protein n=1 Tax=Burkholderia vietnamiensis (strain G4 / LMG 22486) TaxID=269482 RepID=A4JFI5_BURVG|nr:hypothetical protein Bcep1808_2036 [Burkholderia vietnamiensis G4]MCB4344798.1 hypothetical protein [Burkholderia vietnamiensis]